MPIEDKPKAAPPGFAAASDFEPAPAPASSEPEPRLELAPLAPAPPPEPAATFEAAPVGTAWPPEAENPYQAPAATVERPESRDPHLNIVLARRLTRLSAQILNGLIFGVPFFVLLILSVDFTDATLTEEDLGDELLAAAALVAVPIVLVNLFLLAQSGQSLGKKILSIKIVRTDGEPASLLRLVFLRYLAPNAISFIPFLGNLFGLLNILFIFGEERRCIHDYFADTMVVVA